MCSVVTYCVVEFCAALLNIDVFLSAVNYFHMLHCVVEFCAAVFSMCSFMLCSFVTYCYMQVVSVIITCCEMLLHVTKSYYMLCSVVTRCIVSLSFMQQCYML